MADVKDILGLSKFSAPAERPEPKEKKEKAKRPEGLSREAYALLGVSHPVVATQALLRKGDVKSRPKAVSTLTYQWRPFTNPARSDNLKLYHWIKLHKGREDQEEEYQFAKFNKKAQVYRFNDEEWENFVQADSGDWTRQETEYLLDMCERFDLRFIVIADRYQFEGGPSRSVEDLKNRYYKIARALLIGREGGEAPVANHIIVKCPYNQALEEARKAQLESSLSRTLKSEREESKILEEARQIEEQRQTQAAAAAATAAAAAAAAATAAAAAKPSTPVTGTPSRPSTNATPASAAAVTPMATEGKPTGAHAADAAAAANGTPKTPAHSMLKFPAEISNAAPDGQCSLFQEDLQPFVPKGPGAFARGANTLDMVAKQNLGMNAGPRIQKNVDATLEQVGFIHPPSIFTRATSGAYLALRAEVIAYHALKRSLTSKAPGTDGLKKRKK